MINSSGKKVMKEILIKDAKSLSNFNVDSFVQFPG